MYPKTPSSKSQLGLCPWNPEHLSKQNSRSSSTWVFAVATSAELCRGSKQKTPISQSFPERGLFVQFKSCCLRAQLLINLLLGADFGTLTALGKPSATESHEKWRKQPGLSKTLETTESSGQAENKFHVLQRLLHQDRKRWLFYLMHRN